MKKPGKMSSAARAVKQSRQSEGAKAAQLALFGALVGAAMGFVFEKSKVYFPPVIRAQMTFADWAMAKMFLAGTCVGMFAIALLVHVGLQTRVANKIGNYAANGVGGFVMGMGIALAGSCPGTVMAQLGANLANSVFTFLGTLCGALVFVLLHARFAASHFFFRADAALLDEHWGIHMAKVALVFATLVAGSLFLLEHVFPWQPALALAVPAASRLSYISFLFPFVSFSSHAWPPVFGGVLLGLLQLPTYFFIDQNIAASSSYVTLVGLALRPFFSSQEALVARLPYLAPFFNLDSYAQIGSSVGVFFGAKLSLALSGVELPALPPSPFVSFVGGFFVLFGARMAGGCASGHGLSGVARLSSASLVTSAAMFAGAIGSTQLYLLLTK